MEDWKAAAILVLSKDAGINVIAELAFRWQSSLKEDLQSNWQDLIEFVYLSFGKKEIKTLYLTNIFSFYKLILVQ